MVKVTLLGTGYPRPNPRRRGPSQLIETEDARFLVDCGSGVACQLVAAGVSLLDVHHVLITHHHSDHTIDLGHLLLSRWIMGQNAPLHVWAPPGPGGTSTICCACTTTTSGCGAITRPTGRGRRWRSTRSRRG